MEKKYILKRDYLLLKKGYMKREYIDKEGGI